MTSVPLNLKIRRLELPREIWLDWAYTYIIRLLGLVRLHSQNLNSKSRLSIRQFFYTFRLIYNHFNSSPIPNLHIYMVGPFDVSIILFQFNLIKGP
jgi:hypothetical protein